MSLSTGGQAGQGYPAVLVVGIDLYNQCLTGGVSKTLNNRATDADHVPCVLIRGGCEQRMVLFQEKAVKPAPLDMGERCCRL